MSVKSIEYIESTLIYALLICVSALSLDIVLPAYPAISTEFSPLTASELQGNILFFVVGMLFGELLSGPLADRLGRRKVILGCAGVFGVGTLICMLSPAYQWLLLGRAIQGTGAAGFKICTRAIIRDRHSGAAMAKLMSWVMATFIFIPFIAPALGFWLEQNWGWRNIYSFLAIYVALIAFWFCLRHPETLSGVRSANSESSHIYQDCAIFFGTRVSVLYTLVAGILFGVHLGFISLSPLLFADIYGIGAEQFAFYFGAMVCAFGVALFLNGKLVSNIGMRKMVNVGLMLMITTQTAFLSLYWLRGEAEFWMFFVYVFILLFCLGLIFGNLTALIMEPLGKIAGTASALSSSLSTLIAIPLGALLGILYQGDISSFAGPIMLLTAFAVLSIRLFT